MRLFLVLVALIAFRASAQPGALDPTFGTEGVLRPLGGEATFVSRPVQAEDGRILLFATLDGESGVARLLPSGTPDPSFGTDGFAAINLSGLDLPTPRLYPSDLAVLDDGSILIASQISLNADFPRNRGALLKLTAAGALDASFGTGGVAFVDPSRYGGGLVDLAILSDGDILVLATGQDATTQALGILTARFGPDGTPDTDYGIEGIGFAPSTLQAIAFALPDGLTPLVVGRAIQPFPIPSRFAALVARLDADGQIDASFGSGGVLLLDPGTVGSSADGIVFDAFGRAYVTGSGFGSGLGLQAPDEAFVARIDVASGALDADFGTDGYVDLTPDDGTAQTASQSIVLGGDHVTLAATLATAGQDARAVAIRITLDGAFDTGFGDGGVATLPVDDAQASGMLRVAGDRTLLTANTDAFIDGETVRPGYIARFEGGESEGDVEIQIVHDAVALTTTHPVFETYGPLDFFIDRAEDPAVRLRYGEASPFLPAPTNRDFEIRFRPTIEPPAPLPRDLSFSVEALPPGRYVISLMGIPEEILTLYPRRYITITFTYILDGRSWTSTRVFRTARTDVPVTLFHAAPDADALDIRVRETGVVLASGMEPGSGAQASLAPGTYTLDAVPAGGTDALVSQTVVVQEEALSLAVSVRGFVDPEANRDGPPLEMGAVDGTGMSAIATPAGPGLTDELAVSVGPNPARSHARVTLVQRTPIDVRLVVTDALGRQLVVLHDGPLGAGAHVFEVPVERLAPGTYLVRLIAGDALGITRLTVVR